MAKSVIMPRFGMTQEEAEIVHWLCAEGSRVEQGDPICEVTTDKVNMEVEAPATGILTNVRFKEGETVPVTQVIADIVSEQEYQKPDIQSVSEKREGSKTQPLLNPTPLPVVSATPLAQRIAAAEGLSLDGMQGSGTRGKITREDIQRALSIREVPESSGDNPPGKISASPAARSFANQHGIELKNITGTGPGGRVQGWDVRKYQQDFQSAASHLKSGQQLPLHLWGSPNRMILKSFQSKECERRLPGVCKPVTSRLHIFFSTWKSTWTGRSLCVQPSIHAFPPVESLCHSPP
jgi:pyruvate dehydrogenase E2 component (dihydrolipoamide acetyltransferase)